jgi:hypothetical protein
MVTTQPTESHTSGISEIELTGLARFSPRLQLLRLLSRSKDPFMSILSRKMIEDEPVRNTGLIFELIFLIVLPAIYIYGTLGNPIFINPLSQLAPGLTPIYFVLFAGFLYAIWILHWPGRLLMRHDGDSGDLRLIPQSPMGAFKSLIVLQIISFAIYPTVTLIARLFYGISAFYAHDPTLLCLPGPGPFQLSVSLLVHVGLMLSYSLLAIFTSLRFRNVISSYIIFVCLGLLIWLINVPLVLMTQLFNFPVFGGMLVISILLVILVMLITIAITGFMAYSSVKKVLMPKK